MKQIRFLLMTAAVFVSAKLVKAETITLETAPPVVVKTVPMADAKDVDPALNEIRVTYSKPMQDGSWSWSTWGKENFPEIIGQPRYLPDQRTCVLTVKLEPSRFYAIWLNSDKFKNFKDASERPAVPYLLTFHTAKLKAGSSGDTADFALVTETILKNPLNRVAELLDLDTGERATNTQFGENDRETHAWIREHQLDVLGVIENGQIALLCMDMVVTPALKNSFDKFTAQEVLTNWHLAQGEPTKIMALSPTEEKTDTFFFRTREGGQGVLQIIGQNENPSGVKIRYKRLQKKEAFKEDKTMRFEKNIVEDLALQMLVAIREKEDATLKSLATDRIKGWRDALPKFALEMRERFQQMRGRPFNMLPTESLVEGNYAAVKCDDPKQSHQIYLVLFFTKTVDGWKNCSLRNSPPATPLAQHFADFKAQQKTAKAKGTSKDNSKADSERDQTRAMALFNDIEDFGHEFDATFSAKNLPAAKTGVRRLLTLLTNFNAAMEDANYKFPPALFDDIAKIGEALDEGDWDKARALARHNETYATHFRVIGNHMTELALSQRLNDDQRAVLEWTDRQFKSYFDARTFEGMSNDEKSKLETRLLDQLKGPHSRDYYTAINSLAALHSKNALEPLRAIAFDRADKDNRDRWMAIRALGIMRDKTSVPELIHLVYHGNINTRWWAQISLVRLTGQNFGKDWNAWGEWWNKQNGQPPFKPEIIRWWSGQPEPEKLAESLDENDKKFLETLRSQAVN